MDEKKLSFLFENSSDSVYITDLLGNIVEVNKTAINMLSFDKDHILRMNLRDITAYKFKQYIVDNIKWSWLKTVDILK
jgi:PAS domain S-box-containing protein